METIFAHEGPARWSLFVLQTLSANDMQGRGPDSPCGTHKGKSNNDSSSQCSDGTKIRAQTPALKWGVGVQRRKTLKTAGQEKAGGRKRLLLIWALKHR